MKVAQILSVLVLAVSTSGAFAQGANPYAYSGSHAGGPADGLISNGTPVPVVHRPTDPAYRFAGSHAGGPADALIPNVTPAPVVRRPVDPAYRYSGSHAGGPANALNPR